MVVWMLVLAGSVATPSVAAVALYRGGLATGLPPRRSAAVAVTVGAVWGAWVGTSAALAANDVYHDPDAVVPWLGVAALAALIAALLAARIPALGRILAASGATPRPAWPHAVRVLGVLFLIAMVQGTLPAVFALPAGLGDMAIGVAAIVLARRWNRRRAVWFNVFGLLDLVVAVTLGLLGGLATHPILPVSPSTAAMSLLPLALIPTTVVPLDAALHVLSLARLRRATRSAAVPVPAVGS
ncbi:hypothetical protein [Amycolatopsis australiensis]|uniref:Uncharacterized protein n=1 Tax=Amycolatopsis australiensis TaxID=546364 RepID=A0A1K1S5K9_9PSEU|nr:hypothetical protein [Amycolatopsis australiensis]SFW79712.1 hypothetical protein SAMN04489730_4812 [Amycolatopsis australiensis]